MRFDRAGFPFVGGAWLIALVAWIFVGTAFAVPFIALGAFFGFFFRDPHRTPPADLDLILSPADGRVLVAGAALPGAPPEGDWQQVSIFLSLMDVHVNRLPASGIITKVLYRPGRFLIASRKEAATENERSEIWMITAARPCCTADRRVPGASGRLPRQGRRQVRAGDRFGVMKFGSRMDVFLRQTPRLRWRLVKWSAAAKPCSQR